MTIMSGSEAEPKVGCAMKLKDIPLSIQVHNVELKPGKGGQIVRSAGSGSTLMAKEGGYALLTMPSGEVRRVSLECRATIGVVGNSEFKGVKWGKAGKTRLRGRRGHNRGVAMNPIDHPLGGGEGRSGGGRQPCSPQGKDTKGRRTRKKKNLTDKFIVRRRKK